MRGVIVQLRAVLKSTLTGKGYLISASAAGTPAAVAPGANGTVLMADSTKTSGLKWVGESLGLWGDGSDGDHTVTGTESLTRDMYYDTLTVPAGTELKTDNFRIFCKTLCDVQAGGKISNNGVSATGAAAATNAAAGTLARGATGGGSTTTTGNNSGSAAGASLGGNGGIGGTGASGSGGSALAVTAPTATQGTLRSNPQAVTGTYIAGGAVAQVGGGGGGSGGGGDGTAGGGGGAGGGIVLINARELKINGTIEARGGNGWTPLAGNRGGGGAGGGGVLLLNCAVRSGSTTLVAATHVAAGTPGSGTGTGTAGAAGAVGTIRENVWA